ncbi:MAG: hypothetical protein R3E32_07520 [Chitinophagales bacterium]
MKNTVIRAKHIKKLRVTIGLLLLLFLNPIMAQNNWNLTFRGAVDFPTKKMGNATLKTGFGGEATIAYQFLPKLAVYTGRGWSKFSTDKLFGNTNIDIEETGYRAGLRFTTLSPFKYIGILFGAIALTTWGIAVFSPSLLLPFIGMGGTERWVAYPLMLWLTGLGGYLMSKNTV